MGEAAITDKDMGVDVYAVEHPTANKLATHWMLVFADAGSNYTTNKQIKDKDLVVRCRCVWWWWWVAWCRWWWVAVWHGQHMHVHL